MGVLEPERVADFMQQDSEFNFGVLLHEIGHALGLKHAHEVPDLRRHERSTGKDIEFSLMNYPNYIGSTEGYQTASTSPQSFMMYDIAALHHMYGASFDRIGQTDTYTWSATTGAGFIDGVSQGTPFDKNHTEEVHNTTGTALLQSTVVQVSKSAVHSLVRRDHTFAQQFAMHMMQRVARLEEDQIDCAINPLKKRLARTLLILAALDAESEEGRLLDCITDARLARMFGADPRCIGKLLRSSGKPDTLDLVILFSCIARSSTCCCPRTLPARAVRLVALAMTTISTSPHPFLPGVVGSCRSLIHAHRIIEHLTCCGRTCCRLG